MTELPPGATELRAHPKPRVPVPAQIVLVLAVTAAMIVAVLSGAWVNANLTSVNAQLAANNDALREQLIAVGETPVAPPAEVITGEPGEAGATGAKGLPGEDGEAGRSVVAFACQSDGTWLASYDDDTSQRITGPCVGAAGQSVTGAPGADGANGVDGQPPYSWRWVSVAGMERECTRTDPFDPAQPTYVCAITTP